MSNPTPANANFDKATQIIAGAGAQAMLMADLMAHNQSKEPTIEIGRDELHSFLFDLADRLRQAHKLLHTEDAK